MQHVHNTIPFKGVLKKGIIDSYINQLFYMYVYNMNIMYAVTVMLDCVSV